MRTLGTFALALCMPALAALAAAQAKPDFAGRWTVEPPATAAAAPGSTPATPPRGDLGSGWGPTIAITQDAGRLNIEPVIYSRYDLQPQPMLTYALDGSESRQTLMLGRGMQEQSSRARWDADRLSIVTVYAFTDPASGSPQTMQVTRTLTLVAPNRLVVEAAWSGALGGRPTTTRTIYIKN